MLLCLFERSNRSLCRSFLRKKSGRFLDQFVRQRDQLCRRRSIASFAGTRAPQLANTYLISLSRAVKEVLSKLVGIFKSFDSSRRCFQKKAKKEKYYLKSRSLLPKLVGSPPLRYCATPASSETRTPLGAIRTSGTRKRDWIWVQRCPGSYTFSRKQLWFLAPVFDK